MVNTIKKHLIYFILLLAATVYFIACKKADTTVHVQTPTSSFSVSTNSYTLPLKTTNYIDSNFYFTNLSDTSSVIKYQWNFGDGTTSTLKNPKHKYSKRGTYTVSLTVNNNDESSNVSKTTLTVVLGQKVISFGMNINTSAIDVIETADKGFMILGTTLAANSLTQTCFLMKTDSVYNQLSVKNFLSAFSFNSIHPTSDGNYILTGTTTGTAAAQELIKMGADGTVLWSKVFTNSDNIISAQQTPDGGYIVVGNKRYVAGVNSTLFTTITKTDNSGNQIWNKSFNTGTVVQAAVNAVFDSDGIVFAGTAPYTSSVYCPTCDSLIIIKLNNDGSNNWKTTTAWGLNHLGGSTRIAKASDGSYNVIPINGTNGVYFFSMQGVFLNRSLVSAPCYNNSITNDGGIAILQSEFSNGPRSHISKLDSQGFVQWSAYFSTLQDSPVTSHALKNGGSIFVCNKQDYITNGYSYYNSIALLQLADDGSIM